MKEILISCIMANYNTDSTILCQSIESILNQSISSFEFIIIDDCSTNDSRNVLEKFARKDDRIKIIYNQENRGLAYSLNRGIKQARGEFIARMDTDDIAYQYRFEKQLKYINKHNLDVCGTFVRKFGKENNLSFTPFYDVKYSRAHLLVSSYLIHPSVMIRRSFIIENKLFYNEKFRCSQDIELWVRMAQIGRIATVNEVLMKYRIHSEQVSSSKNKLQKDMAFIALQSSLVNIDIFLNNEEIEIYKMLCGFNELDERFVLQLIILAKKISLAMPIETRKNVINILYNRIFNLIIKSNYNVIKKVDIFIKNPQLLSIFNIYSIIYRLYYYIKCCFKSR